MRVSHQPAPGGGRGGGGGELSTGGLAHAAAFVHMRWSVVLLEPQQQYSVPLTVAHLLGSQGPAYVYGHCRRVSHEYTGGAAGGGGGRGGAGGGRKGGGGGIGAHDTPSSPQVCCRL